MVPSVRRCACPQEITSLSPELVVFILSGVWDTMVFFFSCVFLLFLLGSFIVSPVFSMEEITRSWNNLSLDEREGSRITLKNTFRSSEFILAAKFLTKRVLNMEAVARTFRQLWRSTTGFKIRNLHNHVVLFVFNNQGDIDRILRSEPWCFDKHLVVFQQYDCDIPISELNFQ